VFVHLAVDVVDAWCARWLHTGIDQVLFTTGHLSYVLGARLDDGRDVVVKVREPADRLVACADVQRSLWRAGFPCPQPLVGPVPLLGWMANAETLVPGGEILPIAEDAGGRYAELLARLVELAPPAQLAPNPPWVAWDHKRGGVWPAPDDRQDDLNNHAESEWLDDVAIRVQRRLMSTEHHPAVVGHGDWEAQNLRWHGRTPWVVHDWDSLITAPEPVIAGLAASVWTCGAEPRAATVTESDAFIEAYQRARGRRWTNDEIETSWAAGLWVYAFNAKKASLDGDAWLSEVEAAERLRLAGA
jgi:hypothetical protein